MPTAAECRELLENCTYLKTTVEGVEGLLLTSTVPGFTTQSLFFPAPYDYFRSWTSDLCPSYSLGACAMGYWREVDEDGGWVVRYRMSVREKPMYGGDDLERRHVYPIRPVRDR